MYVYVTIRTYALYCSSTSNTCPMVIVVKLVLVVVLVAVVILAVPIWTREALYNPAMGSTSPQIVDRTLATAAYALPGEAARVHCR